MAVLAIVVMQPFLSYILLAGILTYTLFPVYAFLLRRTNRPEVSSAIAILITLLMLILPAVFLVTELVQQVSGAYNSFQMESIPQVGDYLSGLTGNQVDFRGILESAMADIQDAIVGLAPDLLGSATQLVLGLFIMFFVMFYGFREGQSFVQRIKQLLPLDPTLKERLFYEMRTITQAVLYGQVMTALVQGTLGSLGLLVFGVPNWLFWGAIMTITAFIPVLGTPVIWVPAAVGLLLNGDTARGVGLLIYGSTIVMNIDNVIRPRLVSGRAKVHPVLILIGVLGGLKIFGFIGMLVGPLVLALWVALIKFYEEAYIRRPEPVSTSQL